MAKKSKFILFWAQLNNKLIDLLISPKTTLPWLINGLPGAAWLLPFLAPLREAGSMLPQWWIKRSRLGQSPRRDYGWRVGLIIQLVGLSGFCVTIFFVPESGLALGILASLAVLSGGRAFTSVFSKDIQAEFVAKEVRGRFTGLVSSVSGILSVAFAVLLISGILMESRAMLAWSFVVLLVIVTSTLVLSSGLICKRETPEQQQISIVAQFKENPLLFHLVLNRCLLLNAMLAIPFIGSGLSGEQQIHIGWLILISGVASLSSSYFWGMLTDNNNVRTLAFSASMCLAVLLVFTLFVGILSEPVQLLFFYLLLVGYDGVRIGRKTLLLNATNDDNRLAFVGAGNTVVGIFLLLIGGVLSVLFSLLGDFVMWILLLLLSAGIIHLLRLNRLLKLSDGVKSA